MGRPKTDRLRGRCRARACEDDVRYVVRLVELRTYDHALAVITKYYPLERFPQKTLYALAELLPKSP